MPFSKWIDRTGTRKGRLTVLDFLGKRGPHQWWLVRCDCGTEKEITTSNLKGATQSCGCLHRERIRNPRRLYTKLSDQEASMRNYTNTYINSAKHRGFEFALSKAEIEDLAFGNCFYCNSRPVLQGWRSVRMKRVKTEIFLNGIDRVDSDRGYVKGNVVSCCTRCNIAKQDMSVKDFLSWIGSVHERIAQIALDYERNCK